MRITFIVLLMALCAPSVVQAEPTGGRVSILSVRPYSGGLIYVQVSSTAFCDTSVFAFTNSEVNGKEMYAAALTALVSGKEVQLEASTATGCTGWGTRLQSIYLYK
jgi:restriction endonuclease Mrr